MSSSCRLNSHVATTFSERVGDEVYVFVCGRLVMKRWLKNKVSVVFHVTPGATNWNHSFNGVDNGIDYR
jgi:hypothetical protein